jgi:hypothetical protein
MAISTLAGFIISFFSTAIAKVDQQDKSKAQNFGSASFAATHGMSSPVINAAEGLPFDDKKFSSPLAQGVAPTGSINFRQRRAYPPTATDAKSAVVVTNPLPGLTRRK